MAYVLFNKEIITLCYICRGDYLVCLVTRSTIHSISMIPLMVQCELITSWGHSLFFSLIDLMKTLVDHAIPRSVSPSISLLSVNWDTIVVAIVYTIFVQPPNYNATIPMEILFLVQLMYIKISPKQKFESLHIKKRKMELPEPWNTFRQDWKLVDTAEKCQQEKQKWGRA